MSPRLAALDSSPRRMETVLAWLVGFMVGCGVIGWVLGRGWD